MNLTRTAHSAYLLKKEKEREEEKRKILEAEERKEQEKLQSVGETEQRKKLKQLESELKEVTEMKCQKSRAAVCLCHDAQNKRQP